MSKPLNVGLIGCGFMGRTHSNAYRKVYSFFRPALKPVLKAICDVNAEKASAFADAWGYESVETDWRKLLSRKDIDLIDICTPNNTHREIAIAAAEAGKMIVCEKPLAMNAAEGQEMVAAVEKAGVPNLVSFNYRRVPAVTLAKQLAKTLAEADRSMVKLGATLDEARPGLRQFSNTTLPETEALVRDLRVTARALSAITEKIDQEGATGLIGGPPLPDYKPKN